MKDLKSRHIQGAYTSVDELLNCRQLAGDLVLATRKQSRAVADGNVKTRYRGRGMEFAEVRPYQPGDDIRTIDWRVTARVQSPYTKLFQEEHERPVFLLVDQRSPMFFGTRQFKAVFAARFAATVAWIAQANNERVGALIFGDASQHDVRPRRGRGAVLDLINQLVQFNHKLDNPLTPPGGNTLADMFKDASRVAKPGAMVVLVSDFHDFSPDCSEPLALLAKRSDVLAVHTYDPLEQQLPSSAALPIANNLRQMTVNTRKIGKSYTEAFEQHRRSLRQAFLETGIQYIHAPVTENQDGFIRDLFHRRFGAARRNTP